jgi:acetoin utilization protein AcuC
MAVAQAWTMAWAIMKGIEIPDRLPRDFVNKHRAELGQNLILSDLPYKMNGAIAESARQMASSVVTKIKETVFPLLAA